MKNILRENAKLIGFLFVFILFRLTIADWNPIPSGSMRTNLLEGDVVFVNRVAYNFKYPLLDKIIFHINDPKRGDIVTFTSPTTGIKLIKRIAAVPGDVIEMKNKRLIVNGHEYAYKALSVGTEKHPDGATITTIRVQETGVDWNNTIQWVNGAVGRDDFEPITVPANQYLMLGDNRDLSVDSRYIGLVDRHLITGHAIRILVSGDLDNYLRPRFNRFWQQI